MQILANSVWEFVDVEGIERGLYRVLHAYEKIQCVAVFKLQIEHGSYRPFIMEINAFMIGVQEKTILSGDFTLPQYMMVDESEISPAHRRIRQSRFETIKDLVSNYEFLYDYSMSRRSSMLAEFAKVNQLDRKNLSRLLSLFWTYGQDYNAPLPAYKNSGGAGKAQASWGAQDHRYTVC